LDRLPAAIDPKLVQVRQASTEDFERIRAFYASIGRGQVYAGERWVIAEHDGQIVGAVRLCREEGHAVLRTMHIRNAFQRAGLGARMLRALEPLLFGEPCYCLPYTHLPDFYATIGFQIIPLEVAPPHLQARYRQGTAQGLHMLLMRRLPGPPIDSAAGSAEHG
jgi:N-acetylglutamate synthase-like GNAT family acetyltransferase